MRTRLFPVAAAALLVTALVPAIATAAPPSPHAATRDGKKPSKANVAPAHDKNDKSVRDVNAAKPKRTASASSASKPPASCMKPPIEIAALGDVQRFTLTRCDATPAPLAVEHLSIAMRSGGVAKPNASLADLAKIKGDKLAPGIRRADAGLVVRLQRVIDHFGADAKKPAPKVLLVSGYRPASHGSKHAEARALDFKLEGVSNEELLAFCKTLDDTGCGYYPNSTFVHMDVRAPGAGHVTWIDASGPGEAPRYVTSWPPPKGAEAVDATDASSAKGAAMASPSSPTRDDLSEKLEDPDSLPALPMPEGEMPGPFTR